MWTSERNRNLPAREAAAELGTVTLGGDPAGVSLGGERRWLTVYGPGGYSWRPTTQGEEELRPGEVRLAGCGSAIHLGEDGVSLTGQVYINGQTLEELIAAIVDGA